MWAKLSSGPRLRYTPQGHPAGEGNVPALGGGRPGWHRALFAHPRKEEINIDTGLLRHSQGKPALSLHFSPGPVSPSPACPPGACCQACPACSQDSLSANLGTALPTCSLGAGKKLKPRENRTFASNPTVSWEWVKLDLHLPSGVNFSGPGTTAAQTQFPHL